MKKALFIFTILLFSLASCDDPNEGELFVQPAEDASEMSITDVLESQPETYSMWIEFMKYANFYNALKNTDKATIFCPNNKAVQEFLAKRGVNSVQELDLEYAKNVVRTHIINEQSLTDSTINQAAKALTTIDNSTLFNTFLNLSYGYKITDVDDAEKNDVVYNSESIYINNQARIDKYSVNCINGVFFTMGDVIKPLTENIVEKLEMDGNYSIFAAAIRADQYASSIATQVRDTIIADDGSKVITETRKTCFAVPDDVFRAKGINNVDGLKQWLVNNGETKNPDAALSEYLKYHFLTREYSTSELFNFTEEGETLIYDTRLEGQAITASITDATKYVNKTVKILRSDIVASNGYINKVNDIMPVYHPEPVTVRWDFLNSADIIAAVNNYGTSKGYGNLFTSKLTSAEIKVDLSEDFRDGNNGVISSFTYVANESKASYGNYRKVGFYKEAYTNANDPSPKHKAYMNNYLCLNLGYAGWIQFNTPVIIAGKYKVVLHYLKDITLSALFTTGTMTRFDIDDKKVITYLYKGVPRTPLYDTLETTLFNVMEFEGSKSHTFKVTMMDINAKTANYYRQMLDYIEFIPVE